MNRISSNLAAAIALCVAGAACANADDPVGIDLKFVSEVTAIRPGEAFYVGLHVHHHPKFHTYWENPGIVGVPMVIKWDLPEGFEAGPIQYAPPERVMMYDYPAHGYERDVLLIAKITPPKSLPEKEYAIKGATSWMACADTCHPGFLDVGLTLPSAPDAGEPRWDAKWHKEFEAARAALPKPSAAWKAAAQLSADKKMVTVNLTPADGANPDPGEIYLFSTDGVISSLPVQTIKRTADQGFEITAKVGEFAPDEFDALPAVVMCENGWAKGNPEKYMFVEPAIKGPNEK
ncbi:MAG: protein-disulfide reductase DsbD family protein [Verrucomicrobiales bacterium]